MEIWKDIPEYESYYQVSTEGKVRSLDRKIKIGRWGCMNLKGRILKKDILHRGHFRVTLAKNGTHKRYFVHVLVLLTFVGPCPSGFEACHNDGDPSNNNLNNVRWDSHSNNMFDAVSHNTLGKRVKCSDGRVFNSLREASRETGIKHQNISRVCKGGAKTAGGFSWKHI